MTIVMKLLMTACLFAGLLAADGLHSVRTVYVFPMHNAFDQYLVNRMLRDHVLQVVADPTKADAVLTDNLGPAFEDAFDDRVLDLEPDTTDAAPAHRQFSHSRGTLFLVDRSKNVLWSVFAPAKGSSPKDLEKTAERAVKRLANDLNPKPAPSAGS